MCYTGKCRYEGYMGDCTVMSKIPDDAGCVLADKEIDICIATRDNRLLKEKCPICGKDWVEIIIPIVKNDLESPDMKNRAHCISCDWRGLEEELV
jgi:hypothetical protein